VNGRSTTNDGGGGGGEGGEGRTRKKCKEEINGKLFQRCVRHRNIDENHDKNNRYLGAPV
jgi:hypothetical protein